MTTRLVKISNLVANIRTSEKLKLEDNHAC